MFSSAPLAHFLLSFFIISNPHLTFTLSASHFSLLSHSVRTPVVTSFLFSHLCHFILNLSTFFSYFSILSSHSLTLTLLPVTFNSSHTTFTLYLLPNSSSLIFLQHSFINFISFYIYIFFILSLLNLPCFCQSLFVLSPISFKRHLSRHSSPFHMYSTLFSFPSSLLNFTAHTLPPLLLQPHLIHTPLITSLFFPPYPTL